MSWLVYGRYVALSLKGGMTNQAPLIGEILGNATGGAVD